MSFEGEIGEIDLIEKLVSLGHENFTGAIRFENDGIIKIVYFKTGDILSASTNDRSDSIDEILLRAGKVTREHVKQALAKRKESETLGDALLGLGFITRKELTWARRAQAIGILRSLRGWAAGQYTIVEDYLPKREEGTLFPLPQMLVELIVTETDRARFDLATNGGSAVFHKAADFDDAFRRLGLNQDAEDIAGHIDGSNTAADVAASSGKDAFNVYKLLEALRVLGLLTIAQGTSQVSPGDTEHGFAGVGVADAADAWHSDAKFAMEDEPAGTPSPAHPATTEEKLAAFDWDQPAHSVSAAPAESSVPMPSWDEARPAVTREIPAVHVPPPPDQAPEPDWGFDDAQIETARRASASVHGEDGEPEPEPLAESVRKAAKPNRWVGALLVSVGIIILAAAGWFGFQWWQARNAPAEPLPTARASRPHGPVLAPVPAAIPVTATTTGTSTTVATGSAATVAPTNTSASASTTTAPHSGALVVTPATTSTNPPPTPKGVKPSPPVTPGVTAASTTARPPAPETIHIPLHAPAVATSTAAPRQGKPPVPMTTSATPATTAASSAGIAHLERSPTSGNAVITNAGGSVPAGTKDAQRAKYDAMAREHAANAKGAYTIQFEVVCETASLTKAVAAGDKVWFTPISLHGRSCYRVYWGNYATAGDAESAKREIPASLRESALVVVRVPKQP